MPKTQEKELTKPQLRLLRALGCEPFGISLGGKWIGTGRALVSRGLAEGSRSHVCITAAGRAALQSKEKPRG